MRNFFVRVRGADGTTRWVTVSASSQADARERVQGSTGITGWTALGVFDKIEDADDAFPSPDGPGLVSELPAFGTLQSNTGEAGGSVATTGDTATGGFGLGGGTLGDVDINAAFRRALASRGLGELGRRPTNLAQRFAQGRSGAGISSFLLDEALRKIRGEQAQDSETFFGANLGRFGESAGQSFNELQQLIAARQNPAGGKAGIPIFDDPELQNLVNPLDDAAGRISFDAAKTAFEGKFNPIVTNALGGSDNLGSALTSFRSQTGGEGGNFIEFLRRRFGLPQFTSVR